MSRTMLDAVRRHAVALRVLLVLTVLLGVAYPLVVTGLAQVAFHRQANGSLVSHDGTVVGSRLIGQNFTDGKGNPLPQWFQSRPSAAGSTGYDPEASGASNLGPNSPVLVRLITQRRAQVARFNDVPESAVPADAVTASASGLDPDISPAYAYVQVNRVARARGLSSQVVRQLVAEHVDGRAWGFLGEPTVNVLQLNIALATLKP